ncbi:MAG TPA: hypothetical protein VNR18_12145 [Hyphomicrobiales bacterium]|nr:hypothetical protein [Hyphomicrobiales bacterium]
MSDERDPFLDQAFATAERRLDDAAFVADVMRQVTARSQPAFNQPLVICLLLAPALWFAAQTFGDAPLRLLESLSRPLVDSPVQDSVGGSILAPLNNLAGLLGLGAATVYLAYKRLSA